MTSQLDVLSKLWPYLVAIVGGAFTWWSATVATKRKFKTEDRDYIDRKEQVILERMDKENSALRDRLVSIQTHQMSQEVELAQIKILLSAGLGVEPHAITIPMVKALVTDSIHSVETLKGFIRSFPILVWIKKRVGPNEYVMEQVSEAYAALYLGQPASFYEGKTDEEIWPEEQYKIFSENDEKSFERKQALHVKEYIKSSLTGLEGWFRGIKWSVRIDGADYVCGVGIHEAEEHVNTDLGVTVL